MGKAKPKNWAVGRWLIESMTEWEREFIDEMVRGFFEFDTKDSGSFQFGCVEGQIDYRLGERDGKPTVGDESGIVLKREPEKKTRKRK